MENASWIPVETYCLHHQVTFSFIQGLQDHGLIEIVEKEEKGFISADRIDDLEKYTRLYRDLEINLAGIDAISHLLQRLQNMQEEMTELRNRLDNNELE